MSTGLVDIFEVKGSQHHLLATIKNNRLVLPIASFCFAPFHGHEFGYILSHSAFYILILSVPLYYYQETTVCLFPMRDTKNSYAVLKSEAATVVTISSK